MPAAPPQRVYTAEEMREIDRLCVEEFAIPSIILMEHAAIGAAEVAEQMLDTRTPEATAFTLAGPGNNGGDGFALARLLTERGRSAAIVRWKDPKPGSDAETNLRAAEAFGIPIEKVNDSSESNAEISFFHALDAHKPALCIDALFGTGLTEAPRGPARLLIRALNTWRSADPNRLTLALDLPSGLDANTGQAPGECINADATVTFAGLKRGLTQDQGPKHAGHITIAPVGAPQQLLTRFGTAVS